MKEGLFFDGVGACCAYLVIDQRIQSAVDVFSDAAVADLAFGNITAEITEIAFDFFVRFRLPENRCFEVICLARHFLPLDQPFILTYYVKVFSSTKYLFQIPR